MKNNWSLLIFLVGVVLGLLIRCEPVRYDVDKQTDTLTLRETIKIESPAEVRYRVLKDTMYVPMRDTLRLCDTLYAIMPRQSREYKGTQYRALVSGYEPKLDYIEVYPETRQITTIERKAPTKNRVSFGAEVGYTDNFSIPIYIEYERRLHENVGVYGRVVRDMHAGSSGIAVGARVGFGW